MNKIQEAFEKWAEGNSFNESGVAQDAFKAGWQAGVATALDEVAGRWRRQQGYDPEQYLKTRAEMSELFAKLMSSDRRERG